LQQAGHALVDDPAVVREQLGRALGLTARVEVLPPAIKSISTEGRISRDGIRK